jgi:hypothetical protein
MLGQGRFGSVAAGVGSNIMSVAQPGVFASVAMGGIAEFGDQRLRVDLVICERMEAGVENNSKDWKHTCLARTMLSTESVSSECV